jgi:hypothetical protein
MLISNKLKKSLAKQALRLFEKGYENNLWHVEKFLSPYFVKLSMIAYENNLWVMKSI